MTATATATTMTTEVEQVIDQYIATWNETDPAARRELITRTWAEDGGYRDPLMSGEGYDGIDAMIGGVQTQFPGYRFRRVGELDTHHDRVWFCTQSELDTTDSRAVKDKIFGSTSADFGMHRWEAMARASSELLICPLSSVEGLVRAQILKVLRSGLRAL